jgi:hypothetical protein
VEDETKEAVEIETTRITTLFSSNLHEHSSSTNLHSQCTTISSRTITKSYDKNLKGHNIVGPMATVTTRVGHVKIKHMGIKTKHRLQT